MSNRRSIADFPRNEAGLVDEFIGTAFDAVYAIYKNLEKVLQSGDNADRAEAAKLAAELAAQAAQAAQEAANASALAAAEYAAQIAEQVQQAIDARDMAEASAILALGYVEIVQAAVITVNADRVLVEELTQKTQEYAEQVGPIRADFADNTDESKGSALVGHDGDTVQAALYAAKVMQNYAALRAYRGKATSVGLTQTNLAGFFDYDSQDTTTADDGYKTIVSATGRRYKRRYEGPVQLGWFQEISSSNWSSAWTNAIKANNAGGNKGLFLQVPRQITKTQVTLPDVTAPIWINGHGTSESIVFFAGVDGITIDHSGLPAGSACARISNVAFSTNVASKTGLKLFGQATDNPAIKFRLENVEFVPHARAIGSQDSSEWLVALQVGKEGSTVKTAEVKLDDVVISGSLSNTLYATRTQSIGVLCYNVTGFRYNLPKIALVGQGIVMDGQCEGAVIFGGTIFGVDKGVVFRNLVSPANNHVVQGTHVSAYTKGIAFEQPVASAPLSIGNMLSGLFILERESGANKTEDYVGIELYAKYSQVSDTLIWSNSYTGTHNRVGVRATNHNNVVLASFKNCDYPFDVVAYPADADNGCVYADGSVVSGTNLKQIDKSSSANLVYTNLKDPTVGAAALIQRAASWRIRHTAANANLVRINSGGIVLGEHLVATQTIDFSTTTTGTSGYDSRILATGGSADNTSGKGDLQLTCSSLRVNGSVIRGETSGVTSVGSPSIPMNAVYANTGTIQASDRRLKQNIGDIPDEVLDAYQKVPHQMYKFIDAVEQKGEENARWHFGIIAQDFEKAFIEAGLDPLQFATLGYDEWGATEEVRRSWEAEYDDQGNVVVEAGSEVITAAQPAGNRYSVRYDETSNLRFAVLEREIERLKAQIAELMPKV